MKFQILEDVPEEDFDRLVRAVHGVLDSVGVEHDHKNDGDFWMAEEYSGYGQMPIHLMQFRMFHPDIVHALQKLLDDFPGWEIILIVDIIGHETDWPKMGLTLREDEILDALQREYFPPEYRHFAYRGARPEEPDEYASIGR